MKLIIKQDNALIAEVPDYTGPVPQKGDYIFHPPLQDDGREPHGVMGAIKVVTWGILARPANGEGHFVGRAEPFVEVWV